jgi:hypothetical protein
VSLSFEEGEFLAFARTLGEAASAIHGTGLPPRAAFKPHHSGPWFSLN